MQHILRKGASMVYLQYKNVGDSMGADNFMVSVRDNAIVLSFSLRPVDSNQRSDEDRLHSEQLQEIHLSDDYIIEKFTTFLQSPGVIAETLVAEITSRGKVLQFSIALGTSGMGFLPLVVQS